MEETLFPCSVLSRVCGRIRNVRGINKHTECTCFLELHYTSKIKLFISLLCVEEEYRSKCEVRKEHIPKGAVFFTCFQSMLILLQMDRSVSVFVRHL